MDPRQKKVSTVCLLHRAPEAHRLQTLLQQVIDMLGVGTVVWGGGLGVEGVGRGWVSVEVVAGGGVGLTHSGLRCFEHSFESKHFAAENDESDL